MIKKLSDMRLVLMWLMLLRGILRRTLTEGGSMLYTAPSAK